MPRFLAVDYLSKVVDERRRTLKRSLIAEPEHLEFVEPYAHKGIVKHNGHRNLWRKAKGDLSKTLEEDEDVGSYLTQLCDDFPSFSIENYSSLRGRIKDQEDYVPSSNPYSQDSLEDDLMRQALEEDELKRITNESFHCINDLDFDSKKLETPITSDSVKTFLNNVPTARVLSNRLKVQIVSDPLADKDGIPLQENKLMKCDRLYSPSSDDDTPEKVISCESTLMVFKPEPFEKAHLQPSTEDCIHEFESCMSPIKCDKPTRTGMDVRHVQIELEELKELFDISFIDKSENEDKAELLKSFKNLPSKLESVDHSEARKADENTLNLGLSVKEKLVHDEDDCFSAPCLEPPIIHIRSHIGKTLTALKPWKDAEQQKIAEEDDLSSIIAFDNRKFMSQMRQVEMRFIQDKVFYMIEPVIDCKRRCLRITNVSGVVKQFGSSELYDGDLAEADFSWDPLVTSSPEIRQAKRRDLAFGRPGTLVQVKQKKYTEDFSKESVNWAVIINETTIMKNLTSDEASTSPEAEGGNVALNNQKADDTPNNEEADSEQKSPIKSETATEPSKAENKPFKNNQASSPKHKSQDLFQKESNRRDVLEESPAKQNELGKGSTKAFESPAEPSEIVAEDPVTTFMLLRGKNKKSPHTSADSSKLNNSSEVTNGNCEEKNTKKGGEAVAAKPIIEKESITSVGKSKQKVIEVTMSDTYNTTLERIRKLAETCIVALQNNDLVPRTQTFESFSPDITHFIVKQLEKSLEKNKNSVSEGHAMKMYEVVVTLHCLITTADVLIHCCLRAAIIHLSALQEKYQTVLKGNLEGIRQFLFKTHHIEAQNKVLHPKVSALGNAVIGWMEINQRENPTNPNKVLIILRREYESLCKILESVLSTFPDVRPCILPIDGFSSDEFTDRYEKNDVFVVGKVAEDFPIAKFDLVLEYESTAQDEKAKYLCEQSGLQYIGLRAKPVDDNSKVLDSTQKLPRSNHTDDQYIFIGSQNITGNSELLQILETRHNILIMERNFLKLQAMCKFIYCDLILDERNCVIVDDVKKLKSVDMFEPLVIRMSALRLKYETCWIILFSSDKELKKYPFVGQTVSNLAKLQGSAAQFSKDIDNYEVKVLLYSSCTEAATAVRGIADYVCQNSPVWTTKEWVKRDWLAGDLTHRERWLLSLPCMNSFTAQRLLHGRSLSRLAQMSRNEAKDVLKWLPSKVFEGLKETLSRRLVDQIPEQQHILTPVNKLSDTATNKYANPEERCTPKASLPFHNSLNEKTNRSATEEAAYLDLLCDEISIKSNSSSIANPLAQDSGNKFDFSDSPSPDKPNEYERAVMEGDMIRKLGEKEEECSEFAGFEGMEERRSPCLQAAHLAGHTISARQEEAPYFTLGAPPQTQHSGWRATSDPAGSAADQRNQGNQGNRGNSGWREYDSTRGINGITRNELMAAGSASRRDSHFLPRRSHENPIANVGIQRGDLWTRVGNDVGDQRQQTHISEDGNAVSRGSLGGTSRDSNTPYQGQITPWNRERRPGPYSTEHLNMPDQPTRGLFGHTDTFGLGMRPISRQITPRLATSTNRFMPAPSPRVTAGIASIIPRVKPGANDHRSLKEADTFHDRSVEARRHHVFPKSPERNCFPWETSPRENQRQGSESPPMDYIDGVFSDPEFLLRSRTWTASNKGTASYEDGGHPFHASKRRRLSFEKIPGAKGGQTKLSFF